MQIKKNSWSVVVFPDKNEAEGFGFRYRPSLTWSAVSSRGSSNSEAACVEAQASAASTRPASTTAAAATTTTTTSTTTTSWRKSSLGLQRPRVGPCRREPGLSWANLRKYLSPAEAAAGMTCPRGSTPTVQVWITQVTSRWPTSGFSSMNPR